MWVLSFTTRLPVFVLKWIKECPTYPNSTGCKGLRFLLGTGKNRRCGEAETTPAIYKTKPSSANLNDFA